MPLIPVRPPGVFVDRVDDTLLARWALARRWLAFAFIGVPAVGVGFAALLTVVRGLGYSRIATVLVVVVLAVVVTTLIAATGLALLGARSSPSGRSVPRDPVWWIWLAGITVAIQGLVGNQVAAVVDSPGSRAGSAMFPVLLALVIAACYCARRAGRELTDPPFPALGDTDVAVTVLRESGRNVVLALEVLTLAVTADRIELDHRVGRRPSSTTSIGFDRLLAVWAGWAPPGANGVWNARPPGTADRLPPSAPAVVLRTYDQDIFLVVDRADLVAEIIHRRALRFAALRGVR